MSTWNAVRWLQRMAVNARRARVARTPISLTVPEIDALIDAHAHLRRCWHTADTEPERRRYAALTTAMTKVLMSMLEPTQIADAGHRLRETCVTEREVAR